MQVLLITTKKSGNAAHYSFLATHSGLAKYLVDNPYDVVICALPMPQEQVGLLVDNGYSLRK